MLHREGRLRGLWYVQAAPSKPDYFLLPVIQDVRTLGYLASTMSVCMPPPKFNVFLYKNVCGHGVPFTAIEKPFLRHTIKEK